MKNLITNPMCKPTAAMAAFLIVSAVSTAHAAEDTDQVHQNIDVDLDIDKKLDLAVGSVRINIDKNSNFEMDESFAGDVVSAADHASFKGTGDDLYLMGETVAFSGRATGSVTALGETVDIHGDIANNLHAAGKSIRLTGQIGETTFLGAADIVVAESAVVGGTLLAGANDLHIIGQLKSGLLAGAGKIVIDGPVTGDVNVRTGKLTITERGSIQGNLTYGASQEISPSERARVSGEVTFKADAVIDEEESSASSILGKVWFFLTIIASGLLLLLLPAVRSALNREREPASYGKALLWGLIPIFIYPVAILFTIPLYPLAIALALALFPLIWLTTLIGLALAGQFLFKVFKWENKPVFLQFIFACVLFGLALLIPFAKVLFIIAVSALGAGLMIGRLFKQEF